MTADLPQALKNWTTANFPKLQFSCWGQSGAAMLHDALRGQKRSNVVLPAFICPSVTAAAIHAGKRVVHVDVDRTTLNINVRQLETVLGGMSCEDTVLLVDHAFGNPFPQIAEIRASFPELLIVEDCVRALGGAIAEGPIGSFGDWVLISLYKTVPGNDHGGILLTGSAVEVRSGSARKITLRQRVSTFAPARVIYEWLKRRSCDVTPPRDDLESPTWNPPSGIPNRLCLRRFLAFAAAEKHEFQRRRQAADELRSALREIAGLSVIRSAENSRNAEHFLSFTVRDGISRDRFVSDLHGQGLFLLRTWDCIPANFRSLSSTFPVGFSESVFLARHVVHIPISSFMTIRKRRRLVEGMRNWFSANAG